jgi:hypothetical protein
MYVLARTAVQISETAIGTVDVLQGFKGANKRAASDCCMSCKHVPEPRSL